MKMITLQGTPHAPDDVRLWNGDSRGRWDDDTLVVETTNFSKKSNFRGAAENLHLVERFTLVGPDILHYEATITDPTRGRARGRSASPSGEVLMRCSEYACHEGNYGMEGILSGHRADERAAKSVSTGP